MYHQLISSNKILILDDKEDILESLRAILEEEGLIVETVKTKKEAINMLNEKLFDLALIDIWLDKDEEGGIEVLNYISKNFPTLPCIMMSGHATIEKAIYALKIGAYDFLEKPFCIEKILSSIKRALEKRTLTAEKQSSKSKDYALQIIAKSKSIKEAYQELKKLKSANTISLIGEEGVGKKFLAFHFAKLWKKKLYLLDCSQEQISNTFYSIKRIIEKDEESLFLLDHPEKLNQSNQAELLTILRSTAGKQNCQWISSIDYNEAHKLNSSLKERLTIFTIKIPSLKDRQEDFKDLVQIFLNQLYKKTKKRIKNFDMKILEGKKWQGNINQLKLFLENLLYESNTEQTKFDEVLIDQSFLNMDLKNAKTLFEKIYLEKLIKTNNGSLKEASKKANVDRTTIYRKLNIKES